MKSDNPTDDSTANLSGDDGVRKAWQPGDLSSGALVGQFIDRYHILSVLGEGGFGVVYLAERREPHVHRVALKVIKPGMDSKAVIARFEQERQALAVMDHPNVARVIDAGTTERGLPFFAMEFVKGEPITAYCDRHNLSLRGRMELFIPVCEAVQHAHMKGIIHRDIKPSNVLVTVGDSGPIVKVIDFGVAKALSHTLTRVTIFTEHGQLIGTPEYMSPEQAEMGATDIDTRTDVYSLGVLLYELLTGATPFDKQTLRADGYAEIQRIIREVDPPKPSTRLSSLPSAPASNPNAIARRRNTRLDDLVRELRRELDWIPLKAIRKDRTERYRTATDLADDIQRYLNGEALEVGPEAATYRLRKFIRRNRGPVAAVAIVMLVLLGGIIGTSLGMHQARLAGEAEAEQRQFAQDSERRAIEAAQRADREAERAFAAEAEAGLRAEELKLIADFQASQLADIETELMGISIRRNILDKRRGFMEAHGIEESEIEAALHELEHSLTGVNFTDIALETLDENIFERALIAIDEQSEGEPQVRARLLQTLATTMRNLGLVDRATEPQVRALEIRRIHHGDQHRDTLVSLSNMGALLEQQGRYHEAKQFYEEALAGWRSVEGADHVNTFRALANLGTAHSQLFNLTEAASYFNQALDGFRVHLGDDHPDTLGLIGNLAMLTWRQGNHDKAEIYYREAIDGYRRVLDTDHPKLLSLLNQLGGVVAEQGRLHEAEVLLRASLHGSRRALGDEHTSTLHAIMNLGNLLLRMGRLHEAAPFFHEALNGRRRALGPEHPDTLASLYAMGYLFMQQGSVNEAEFYFRQALDGRLRTLGPEHANTLLSMYTLGSLLAEQDSLDEAELYLRQAEEGFLTTLGDEHPYTLLAINGMGVLLKRQQRFVEAEPYLRKALQARRSQLGDENMETLNSMSNLGSVLRELGRFEEAARLLGEVVETGKRVLPPHQHVYIANTLGEYSLTLMAMQRFAEAEEHMLEAHRIATAEFGTNHTGTISVIKYIAVLYDAWQEHDPEAGHDAKAAAWRAKLSESENDAESDSSD